MSWSLFGERLDSVDMVGTPRVHQPFVLNKNMNIKAFRTWVIVYNSPVFTELFLDVWSNENRLPVRRLWRSDKSWTLQQITATDGYAAKEIYFDFDLPISLRADEYHLALCATGYTGNSTSHLAWVRGIPDPNNATDISLLTKWVHKTPFYVGVVDELR